MKKITVGQNIRRFRKEKKLTQSELAELIGVSVQAISKWETDAGIPDISQIVPLARVLEVSTDCLLGMEETEQDAVFAELKSRVGTFDTFAFDFAREGMDTKNLYEISVSYFEEHPTFPMIAYYCLRGLAQMITENPDWRDKASLIAEGERYANCISRFETAPDRLFRAYYVLARIYRALNEPVKAEDVMAQIPEVYGDRVYFEAEVAMADGDYETALQKCRESFSTKARFMSRCIRMASQIHHTWDKGNNERVVIYNEYMLNVLNALMSGSDFLPMRQTYQKYLILYALVTEYLLLGKADDAFKRMEELLAFRKEVEAYLNISIKPAHLMLLDLPDDRHHAEHCVKEMDEYIQKALEAMTSSPLTSQDSRLQEMKESFASINK